MNVGEVCRREVYIFKAEEPLANAVAEGATYTVLRVACEGGKWLAQTVVDV